MSKEEKTRLILYATYYASLLIGIGYAYVADTRTSWITSPDIPLNAGVVAIFLGLVTAWVLTHYLIFCGLAWTRDIASLALMGILTLVVLIPYINGGVVAQGIRINIYALIFLGIEYLNPNWSRSFFRSKNT